MTVASDLVDEDETLAVAGEEDLPAGLSAGFLLAFFVAVVKALPSAAAFGVDGVAVMCAASDVAGLDAVAAVRFRFFALGAGDDGMAPLQ